jgi:preprotein translocase subunit SecY
MSIKNIISKIPGVSYPRTELSIQDRIKWTLLVGAIFLFMGFTPLPYNPEAVPFYYQPFTIIAIGIVPIILGVELLQILLRFNIIRLDLGKREDRLFFYGIQKIFIVVIAFFEAFAVLFGFHLAGSLTGAIFLMSLLIFGVIALTYMDEIVVKWGIGSGLGLFISISVIKWITLRLFNVGTDINDKFLGIIPNFLDLYVNRGVFDLDLIFPVITTAVIFALIYFGFKRDTEFKVSSGEISGKYSMKFFYTSTLAVTSGLIWYLGLQELDGIFKPAEIYKIFDLSILLYLVTVLILVLIYSVVVGYVSTWIFGLNILYLNRSQKVDLKIDEEKLGKKITKMVIISSLAVGILSLFGDLFGIILEFGGALIMVGYLFRCQEEIKGPKKVCPSCGCLGIEWLLPPLWSVWECRNCGYRGIIAIDIEE